MCGAVASNGVGVMAGRAEQQSASREHTHSKTSRGLKRAIQGEGEAGAAGEAERGTCGAAPVQNQFKASVHGSTWCSGCSSTQKVVSEDPGEQAVHLVPEVHSKEEEEGKEEQVGHVV